MRTDKHSSMAVAMAVVTWAEVTWAEVVVSKSAMRSLPSRPRLDASMGCSLFRYKWSVSRSFHVHCILTRCLSYIMPASRLSDVAGGSPDMRILLWPALCVYICSPYRLLCALRMQQTACLISVERSFDSLLFRDNVQTCRHRTSCSLKCENVPRHGQTFSRDTSTVSCDYVV